MANRSLPLKVIALAVLVLAAAGVGLWWPQIYHFSVWLIEATITVLRDAGPWAFFGAFAVLPAVGFPISVFYVTAGTAFTEKLGMGAVLTATGGALLVNLSLSYWLGRYLLRPWLEKIISRTKYRIPVVAAAEHAEITVLLRVTPGPPYFLQSYLLGLANVSFGTYLWISWVISIAYATGFIVFGDAILHGRGKVAFLGLLVLIAVSLAVHLLRRHYGKKRP